MSFNYKNLKKKLEQIDKRVIRYVAVFTVVFLCSCIYGGQRLWGKAQTQQQPAVRLDNEQRETKEAVTVPREVLSSTQSVTEEQLYYVYICGAVEQEGVYQCKAGSRLYEAIEQAGGFLDEANKSSLNLVDLVADGQKIYVPSKTESEESGVVSEEVQQQVSNRVNLNTASKEQLLTLPGIGESKAEDIIKYRSTNGKFQKPEDIKKISGIKEAAYNKIKDKICV